MSPELPNQPQPLAPKEMSENMDLNKELKLDDEPEFETEAQPESKANLIFPDPSEQEYRESISLNLCDKTIVVASKTSNIFQLTDIICFLSDKYFTSSSRKENPGIR